MKFDAKVIIKSLFGSQQTTQTIEGGVLTDVKIRSYMHGDDVCDECLRMFNENETVIAIMPSSLIKDGIRPSGFSEYSIPLDKIHLVHVKNSNGNTCLEDFIARFIPNYTATATEGPDTTKRTEVVNTNNNNTTG